MSDYYIRDKDGTVRGTDDCLEWARWMESRDDGCIVKQDMAGDVLVETVFLGLAHGSHSEKPVLWETMIFGSSEHSGYQERYTSEADALAGHQEVLALLATGKELPT